MSYSSGTARRPSPVAVNPLNASELIFPTLEVFHIAGMAILVGTIALADFRLLGWGLTRQTPAAISQDLAPWTLTGLILILISGPLMFSSDPDMYYLNRAFQIKMVLLTIAIIFHYTTHHKAVRAEPASGKRIAWISLALWTAIIACGIFIAFI